MVDLFDLRSLDFIGGSTQDDRIDQIESVSSGSSDCWWSEALPGPAS